MAHEVLAEMERKRCKYVKSLLQSVGTGFYLAPHVVIHRPERVAFGANCAVNEFVHILGAGGVEIGDGVWIANGASIISETHPADVEFIGDVPPVLAPVRICDNVWIGSRAVILPGVTLGASCIVAAGAVVTKDVAPFAIVAGVPARILRFKRIT